MKSGFIPFQKKNVYYAQELSDAGCIHPVFTDLKIVIFCSLSLKTSNQFDVYTDDRVGARRYSLVMRRDDTRKL